MKTSLIIFVVLFAVTNTVAAKEKKWRDFRMVSDETFSFQKTIQVRANNTPTCTTTGRVCDDDCKQIWVCSNSNGELKPGLIETCTGNKTCNAGYCNSTPTPECSPAASKPFACLAEGVFPDPTTCKKYHYCIQVGGEFVDYPRTCDMHYGYNPGNTYCSKNLTNNHCGAEYPVPICTSPGQHAALKDNKSVYYICSLYGNTGDILYPYLHLCPHGQQYDSNYGCK